MLLQRSSTLSGIRSGILLCLHAFFSFTLSGQDTDSTYIERFDQVVAIKLSGNDDIETFRVNSDPLDFQIAPNIVMNSRVSFNYRFMSFSFSHAPRFIPGNDDNDLKGSSRIRAYDLNLQFTNWIQDFSFRRIEGFYLQNTEEYIPNWRSGTDPYIQFPELHFWSLRGITGYKVNENFSLKALSTQTERQIKTAGSLIPLIWYRYYVMDNRIELTPQSSSQRSNNLETTLQLGYFHTFVIRKNGYVSMGLAAGGGLIHSKLFTRYYDITYVTLSTEPLIRAEGAFSFGYNGKKFYSGLQSKGRIQEYRQGNSTSTIINQGLIVQVFIGYRFQSPEWLKRSVDRVPFVD